MLRRLLVLSCGIAFACCAQDQVRNPRASAADVEAGARTFRSHCSPCHGMNAEGGRGPNLASGRFYHGGTDADLLRNISNGIDGTEMPGLFYSPDRVWQVIAYIRSLNASSVTPAGDAHRGEALFHSQECAQCHRIGGQGGRLGPDLTQIGTARSAAYLRESITDPDAYVNPRYWLVSCTDGAGKRLEGFLMNEDTYTAQFIDAKGRLHSIAKAAVTDYRISKTSRMPSYKGRLTGEQLEDLVAYLSSLGRTGESQ